MSPSTAPLSHLFPFFPSSSSSSSHPSTSPILLALDFEAHEHPPYPITEIGLATLDPSILPPASATWPSSIKGTHIIISETSHLINKDFLHGCPQDYRFGTSLSLPRAEAISFLTEALRDERGVVLIAHNLPQERRYLVALLGESWRDDSHVVMELDSQRLVSTKKRLVGLARMVEALGLEGGGMHNAGNDAGWTLRAVVEMLRREMEDEEGLDGVIAGLKGTGGQQKTKVWKKRKWKGRASREAMTAAVEEAIVGEEKVAET